MTDNLPYWYNGVNGSMDGNTFMPPQAIPKSKKDQKWKEKMLDFLEYEGLSQLNENLRFKDFYRMVDGKMSYAEISEVIPQLREVDDLLNSVDVPTFLKHYDLIGVIINALVGEYMLNTDKFNVSNVDDISTNEFERDKQELVSEFIKEQFDKELNIRLAKEGINIDIESIDFNNEKEKQEYINNINSKKMAMTPPEIEVYMSTRWRTKASIWGEHTLEADKERFYLDELDRNEIKDFLLTGRCFRHFYIGYDYYKPETWSPINTFFSQDLETKYVQDGDYVGRIHYYTPSQVIDKNSDILTLEQKELIMGSNSNYYNSKDSYSVKSILENNFGKTIIAPNKQYFDYNYIVGMQNQLGIPMGKKTIVNKNGEEVEIDSFLPPTATQNAYNNPHQIRDDLKLRGDLIRAVEVYFRSYKKIGYFTYRTENGTLVNDIVTEDILKDLIKELGIKQVKNKTLKDVEKNQEENTIVWDYIPEIWKGKKFSGGTLKEPLYIDIEPLEFQLKGDSNIYDLRLPVSGIVDSSLVQKMLPAQSSYNIVMNQIYNLLEKEIGLFFLFDINFLPSEYKDWGDTEETLIHLLNITKDTGLFPIDSSKQNVRDGGGFNGFSAQNISFSSQLADRMRLSEFFKNEAYRQIGVNPQRLGSPTKYETATGVMQSQTASYAQTEIYFSKFGDYKKRMLEMHLSVAQYAQKNNKDITVFYTKSDSSKSFLKFQDSFFQLRKLGILPVSNSKKRKELEQFKSYLMSTNTLGTDELALAELFTSDTIVELIEVARSARIKKEQDEQSRRQHDIRIVEEQSKKAKELEEYKWKMDEVSKQRDRDNKIEVERIDALGRAADGDANINSLNLINKQADLALKKQKQDADIKNNSMETSRKINKDKMDYELKMKKLKNDIMKTEAIIKKSNDNKYIAEINKN